MVGRVTGRPLHIARGPAQKGDMRDTYADTSLARADLGFRPTVSLADGLAAEYRWLSRLPSVCMTQNRRDRSRCPSRRCVTSLLARGACGGKKDAMPKGIAEPDKFLFDRGTELLNEKKWLTAREFFGRLVDNYPQSPYRPDAKLGVGDAYLGEGSAESLVLAVNEFKEFLSFYPTHQRADYAQYKLGMCALPADARPASAISAKRARRCSEFETFVAQVSEQPADARGAGAASAKRAIGSACRSTASATSTSASAGIPAPSPG